MFSYASVKSIALENNFEFGFARRPNENINNSDAKFGCEVHTVFPNTVGEFCEKLPNEISNEYFEVPTHLRKTNWQQSALEVQDNTFMHGHFISARYFEKNIDLVRQWFKFPDEIVSKVDKKLSELRMKYPNRKLIAVHFRINKEYFTQGRRLADSYWKKAARKISSDNPVFVLFGDSINPKNKLINWFLSNFQCEIPGESLVHDMCMISRCDGIIISNSSFACMAAILNPCDVSLIFRPSVYPIGKCNALAKNMNYPDDCFRASWTIVEAHQDFLSWVYITNFVKFASKVKKTF